MTNNQNNLPLNQILLTDCINLLKSIPDESIDLVVSSPPYNLRKEYEARKALEIYLKEQTIILQEYTRTLI